MIGRVLKTPLSLLALAGTLALGAAAKGALGRRRKLQRVDPCLRSVGLATMPPIVPALVPLMRIATQKRKVTPPPGIEVQQRYVASRFGGPDIRVVTLRREDAAERGRALLWLHGGGHLIGTPEIDFLLLGRMLEALDVTIYSVDYRLAPQFPFPAAHNDAFSVLQWLVDNGADLGIRPGAIAIGGNSAGGGLAAGVAQRAHDEGIALACQALMYPMLDDRTACLADHEGRGELVWTPANNRLGWSAFLGQEPGAKAISPYAAPARRETLAGLAPAWIGVGTLDLFYSEDLRYAERLVAAGVPCETAIVPDAPHAFDLLNFEHPIARGFHEGMIAALEAGFARKAPA